ncbi:GAF domain-containing protein, partial [Chitinilyticum litopenaei]|uniref:GAF domain-containing protein n=1 Tax=Chitinilyticum litopenaei TaxID=1121276 RepID=UPI0005BA0FB5
MQAPQLPPDEDTRIAELRSLLILDTPPEERFDNLTRLAAGFFRVPIALVSLVDSERQWFKSACGLNASETARDISFCGHAILGDEVMVVEDALADPRFADNPLVTDAPHIRFYAGAPLTSSKGHKLGTLCLIGDRPRHLAAEEMQMLKDLARLVVVELERDPA